MEKSIETIWKEGFLESEKLVAPKLNNLYNQKSKHIIDKFTRMFKINLIAIVVGSFIVLVASIIVGIPYMGVSLFFLVNGLVIINRKLLNTLRKIDKGVSSYQYLKAFDNWMKEQISVNTRISRYFYPLIFLSLILGFWFGSFGGDIPGEALINELVVNYPDIYLVNGIPLIGILGVILVTSLLAFFGGWIYKIDVNLVYGRVFRKLEEIIADMEELRKD